MPASITPFVARLPSPTATPGRAGRQCMASALGAALLLVAGTSGAKADGLFGPNDVERQKRPWFGATVERLYEDVRARLVAPVEASVAKVIEGPAVQGAIAQAEIALRSLADRASHDLLDPIARSLGSRQDPAGGVSSPSASDLNPVPVATGTNIPPLHEDPLEKLNRAMFGLNNSLRAGIFEPAAEFYFRSTSRPVQIGVRNFFMNLREPATVVSNLIEGRPSLAGSATARFGINTLVGVAGVFDPATDMGFPAQPRNLEQSLCAIGLRPGPYVVLPILGPATVRDSVGRIATAVAYFTVMGPAIYIPYRLTDIALQYAELGDRVNAVTALSADPYATQKALYLAWRALDCGSQAVAVPELFTK